MFCSIKKILLFFCLLNFLSSIISFNKNIVYALPDDPSDTDTIGKSSFANTANVTNLEIIKRLELVIEAISEYYNEKLVGAKEKNNADTNSDAVILLTNYVLALQLLIYKILDSSVVGPEGAFINKEEDSTKIKSKDSSAFDSIKEKLVRLSGILYGVSSPLLNMPSSSLRYPLSFNDYDSLIKAGRMLLFRLNNVDDSPEIDRTFAIRMERELPDGRPIKETNRTKLINVGLASDYEKSFLPVHFPLLKNKKITSKEDGFPHFFIHVRTDGISDATFADFFTEGVIAVPVAFIREKSIGDGGILGQNGELLIPKSKMFVLSELKIGELDDVEEVSFTRRKQGIFAQNLNHVRALSKMDGSFFDDFFRDDTVKFKFYVDALDNVFLIFSSNNGEKLHIRFLYNKRNGFFHERESAYTTKKDGILVSLSHMVTDGGGELYGDKLKYFIELIRKVKFITSGGAIFTIDNLTHRGKANLFDLKKRTYSPYKYYNVLVPLDFLLQMDTSEINSGLRWKNLSENPIPIEKLAFLETDGFGNERDIYKRIIPFSELHKRGLALIVSSSISMTQKRGVRETKEGLGSAKKKSDGSGASPGNIWTAVSGESIVDKLIEKGYTDQISFNIILPEKQNPNLNIVDRRTVGVQQIRDHNLQKNLLPYHLDNFPEGGKFDGIVDTKIRLEFSDYKNSGSRILSYGGDEKVLKANYSILSPEAVVRLNEGTIKIFRDKRFMTLRTDGISIAEKDAIAKLFNFFAANIDPSNIDLNLYLLRVTEGRKELSSMGTTGTMEPYFFIIHNLKFKREFILLRVLPSSPPDIWEDSKHEINLIDVKTIVLGKGRDHLAAPIDVVVKNAERLLAPHRRPSIFSELSPFSLQGIFKESIKGEVVSGGSQKEVRKSSIVFVPSPSSGLSEGSSGIGLSSDADYSFSITRKLLNCLILL